MATKLHMGDATAINYCQTKPQTCELFHSQICMMGLVNSVSCSKQTIAYYFLFFPFKWEHAGLLVPSKKKKKKGKKEHEIEHAFLKIYSRI